MPIDLPRIHAVSERLHMCARLHGHDRNKRQTPQSCLVVRTTPFRPWPTQQWAGFPGVPRGARSLDQPCAASYWCRVGCHRPPACVPTSRGLQGKNRWQSGRGRFPVALGRFYGDVLGFEAHSGGSRSCSARRTASAGFHLARQHRAPCFANAVVLPFQRQHPAKGHLAGVLPWILVTLLQPRVTRDRKESRRVPGSRYSSGCSQRRPARDI